MAQPQTTWIAAAISTAVLFPVMLIALLAGVGATSTSAVLASSCGGGDGDAVSTPIMGRSPVSADDLSMAIVDRYGSELLEVHLVVTLYEEIGTAAGVRWDWAVAQAVLETGGFTSNGWKNDFNPAGIGHFDGQASGFGFEAMRPGIEAHIGLLAIYATGSTTLDVSLSTPVAGEVTTFGALQGTWATAENYAQALTGVYQGIVPPPADDESDPGGTSTPTAPRCEPTPGGETTSTGEWVTVRGVTDVDRSIVANVDAMLAAAEADGLTLTGWAGRTTARQIELRKQHCGTSHYAIYEMPSRQCRPHTARPGSSMHERGLAIDFDHCSSRSSTCFQWLSRHARDYGLFNYPEEPWHWSVNGN